MKNKDKLAWREKNKRLNENVILTLGMRVIDEDKNRGVVVDIREPEPSDEANDHGTVTVWQRSRFGYGGDNCEHYTFPCWKEFLRIDANQDKHLPYSDESNKS